MTKKNEHTGRIILKSVSVGLILLAVGTAAWAQQGTLNNMSAGAYVICRNISDNPDQEWRGQTGPDGNFDCQAYGMPAPLPGDVIRVSVSGKATDDWISWSYIEGASLHREDCENLTKQASLIIRKGGPVYDCGGPNRVTEKGDKVKIALRADVVSSSTTCPCWDEAYLDYLFALYDAQHFEGPERSECAENSELLFFHESADSRDSRPELTFRVFRNSEKGCSAVLTGDGNRTLAHSRRTMLAPAQSDACADLVRPFCPAN